MENKITGHYTALGTYVPDFDQISDEYWDNLYTTIHSEVKENYPTFSDLCEGYYAQLVGLWLVALSSAVTFGLARMILR